ncbi:MAG: EF-hand domain-containing protein, partial [Planctomycetota bacterium]|nr:EF-hand domain-containing protein [Planctomycetota bacterium]
ASHAQELPRGGGSRERVLTFDSLLTRFDTNKDGRIEKKEVPENLLARFDRLDRSKDGVLTREEFGN